MKRLSIVILLLIFSFSIAKAQPGSIDWSFQPDFDCNANGLQQPNMSPIAVQKDGKVISGGNCSINFVDGNKQRNLFRLNPDGTLDSNFKIGSGVNHTVLTINILSDDKILVSGFFSELNGIKCFQIIKLNSDGSIDSSFHPPDIRQNFEVVIQPDDKILIYKHDSLIRLHKNGRRDLSFKKAKITTSSYGGKRIILLSNGNIVLFSADSLESYKMSIFNTNGIIKSSFPLHNEFSIKYLSQIIPISNDKFILCGEFFTNFDLAIKHIVRLNIDGTLDTTFSEAKELTKLEINMINSCFIQRNNKIILGGSFVGFEDQEMSTLVRLNPNGSLDTGFSIFNTLKGFNNSISSICKYTDKKIIVSGHFNSYNSFLISKIARVNIMDISEKFNFSISPNPTAGKLKINSSQSLKLITITDAAGKEILRTEPMAFDAEIDLSDKSSGVYFVTAFSDGASKCQKILKQ